MAIFGSVGHYLRTHLTRVMATLFVMLILVNAVWFARNYFSAPWDPLAQPAVQTVRLEKRDITLQDGTVVNLPVLEFDANIPELHLPTHGVKCTVDPEESVKIVSTTWYETTSPNKEAVQTANGTSTRQGCVEKDFNNLIPYAFLNVASPYLANGPVVARLYGVETPTRDDGTTGVPHRWETEPFAVVKKQ